MKHDVILHEPTALTPIGVGEVRNQIQLIQELMRDVMKDGEHFGKIPGSNKPSLFKAGAEKLGFTFRLTPVFEITETPLDNGHRDYRVTCTLDSIATGRPWGQGVGSCSTMESKYRYREAQRLCPSCGKPAIRKSKPEFGGGYYCWNKIGGCGAKFQKNDDKIESQATGRIENPDIADLYNTALKMAKKRAHVDAILTATAASDIFTQDIEETADGIEVASVGPAAGEPVTGQMKVVDGGKRDDYPTPKEAAAVAANADDPFGSPDVDELPDDDYEAEEAILFALAKAAGESEDALRKLYRTMSPGQREKHLPDIKSKWLPQARAAEAARLG